ncbi:MAG: MATE family efflux transporter [Pseudomonadota bacterium]
MTAAGEAVRANGRREITHWQVLAIAAPVVVSNATVPLQGAIDTLLIGNLGIVAALGAVGLGAEIFTLMLGSFNFLQIGVSGLTAQALGAEKSERVAHTLMRGLIIGAVIATGLLLLQGPLSSLALGLFEASAETEAMTAAYFSTRIWGAPGELMNYALLGWFTGQAMTRRLLQHQLVLTLSNIGLSILFVRSFGWGVEGVALATVIANYIGLSYALWLARRRLRLILPSGWRPDLGRILRRSELVAMMTLNRDIFIRTMLLVGAFAWMARLGSMQGDEILAANVVLWQFFGVSAYALDGFAMAAETLVGQAIGARDPKRLNRAAWMTTLWSGGLSVVISLLFFASAGSLIDLFTTAESVRETARDYVLWAAFVPLAGFLAFQMDGVFIGATASREMRNTMVVSSLFYYPGSWLLMESFGNHGIWGAIWAWLLIRGVTLLLLYPSVRARALVPRAREG